MAGLLAPPVSQAAVARATSISPMRPDALGGYQGTVVATRREWAKNNADTVVGFIRAYRQVSNG